jgi:glycosyl transferase family WecB/TagA/CpsF
VLTGSPHGADQWRSTLEVAPPTQLFPSSSRTRVRLLGLDLDPVTEAEAIAMILRGLDEGEGGFVVTPNLDHLRQLSRNGELAALFSTADLVVADGMPLVWASRLRGLPLPERVAGSELIWSLTAEWLHRLVHDPRRLASRYLGHDLPFAGRLFAHARLSRFGLREDVRDPRPPGTSPSRPERRTEWSSATGRWSDSGLSCSEN